MKIKIISPSRKDKAKTYIAGEGQKKIKLHLMKDDIKMGIITLLKKVGIGCDVCSSFQSWLLDLCFLAVGGGKWWDRSQVALPKAKERWRHTLSCYCMGEQALHQLLGNWINDLVLIHREQPVGPRKSKRGLRVTMPLCLLTCSRSSKGTAFSWTSSLS